jgi:hypothetical protein
MTEQPSDKEIYRVVRKQQAQEAATLARQLDSMQREQQRLERPERKAYVRELERQSEAKRQRMLELRAKDAEAEAERIAERDAELEAALAETKEQMFREWQAEHPELGRATFNAKVWPVRREQMTSREAMIEAEKQRLLNSGRYSF